MFRPKDILFVAQDFHSDAIDECAHKFCASALSKLSTYLRANGYHDDYFWIVTLLLEELFQLKMKYVNGHISYNETNQKPVEISEMIQYLLKMLFGNLTGLNINKTIDFLFMLAAPYQLTTEFCIFRAICSQQKGVKN